MSRDELTHLQSVRLARQVERVYHQVPFYRQALQERDIDPRDIKSLADLSLLPFTHKADLKEHYPFGLLAIPESEIVRVHASSGTTGKPTVVAYSRRDIAVWEECVARCLAMAGIGPGDKIQVAYGYGLFTGGLGLHYGAENIGATVIPISTSNSKRQLEIMEDLGTTAIACTPSYLAYLMGGILENELLSKIKLSVAICGGEPWTAALREKIEEGLGIEIFDIYGLSEIMGPGVCQDCLIHEGSHIQEDYFLPEIIDPETLENLAPGETGELVITKLSAEALPLLRYRTGDLTSLTYEKCACGRTTARISRFKGRTDDMLIIRGVNVFPSQIEHALMDLDGTSPHYQIVLTRENNQDQFVLKVEVAPEFFSDEVADLQRLRKNIEHRIRQAIGLRADVQLVEPNFLERSTGKLNKVVDLRDVYEK